MNQIFFSFQQKEQFDKLKEMLEDEVTHHEAQIRQHLVSAFFILWVHKFTGELWIHPDESILQSEGIPIKLTLQRHISLVPYLLGALAAAVFFIVLLSHNNLSHKFKFVSGTLLRCRGLKSGQVLFPSRLCFWHAIVLSVLLFSCCLLSQFLACGINVLACIVLLVRKFDLVSWEFIGYLSSIFAFLLLFQLIFLIQVDYKWMEHFIYYKETIYCKKLCEACSFERKTLIRVYLHYKKSQQTFNVGILCHVMYVQVMVKFLSYMGQHVYIYGFGDSNNMSS